MTGTDASFNRRRDAFPSLDRAVHLLSHSLGPLPAAARGSMREYCDVWEGQTDEDAWARQWWDLSMRVGDSIAPLIGAARGTVVPQPSATAAMASVASCLDYASRPRVVTTALDFPSMGYLWSRQESRGAEVVVVPSDDRISVDAQRVAEAIDERTALVAVSHVSYRSSARLDPAPIVERARRVGAMTLFDVYQGAGAVEIDARAWGADFLIGGSIKWLCGGPACGWLHVREGLAETLEPALTGWFGHADPLAFEHGPVRPAPGVRRFMQGTPSIPALYSALPGIEIVASVGIDRIARESRRRTRRIVERARERGWPIASPLAEHRRGGTVMLGFADPQRVAERLRQRRVLVDWRPGVGIRLSPHFFNTDEEIDEALEAIEAAAG